MNTPSQTVTQCAVRLKEFTLRDLHDACLAEWKTKRITIDQHVTFSNFIHCFSEAILNEIIFETDKEVNAVCGVIYDSEGRSYKWNKIFTINRPGTFRSLDANWNI